MATFVCFVARVGYRSLARRFVAYRVFLDQLLFRQLGSGHSVASPCAFACGGDGVRRVIGGSFCVAVGGLVAIGAQEQQEAADLVGDCEGSVRDECRRLWDGGAGGVVRRIRRRGHQLARRFTRAEHTEQISQNLTKT